MMNSSANHAQADHVVHVGDYVEYAREGRLEAAYVLAMTTSDGRSPTSSAVRDVLILVVESKIGDLPVRVNPAKVIFPPRFMPLDRVRRRTSQHEKDGTIRAMFNTKGGKLLYVFEYDDPAGLCHICGGEQLAMIERPPCD